MNTKMIEILKALRVPLELNTKPGDKVLFITDTRIEQEIWSGMAAAANELGLEPTIAIMTPRISHGYDPTTPIMAAALDPELSLVIYLTSTAMAHSTLSEELIKQGKKFILMEEVTSDMLLQGGPAYADYVTMGEMGDKVADIFTNGSHIRVQSDLGTDLTAIIEGRPGRNVAGKVVAMSTTGGGGCAFPDGEVHVCPIEGTGEGIIVFDTTAHSVGLLKEPIRLTVEKGMVTKIEGGIEAEKWRQIFDEHGDPNSYNCPAEIAIGTNPNVTITGSMRTDKKVYGGSHIGVGDTLVIGGTCEAKLRLEGVIKEPIITVDGRILTKGGKILIK
jgi:leucyl aminopeptidase (aminopeptidase T)